MKKFSAFMKRFGKAVIKNWPMKLLSLVLAVCLWAGLITQDDTLTRERSFTDATIAVTGADTLRRNNSLIVVSGLEEENLNVRMKADVPQSQYNNVTAANYNPRVDLSKITETGEQKLKVLTTSVSAYGNVTYLMPDTVTVMVEEYVTNYRIPVVVRITEDLPQGWYGSTPTTDPTYVTVSGPRSIVDQIARVCVDYSLSGMTMRSGRYRTARPFTFESEDGSVIVSDQIEVTSENVLLRSIIVNQMVYACKSVPISIESAVTGTPADGYQVTEVSVSPTEVSVAADDEALENINQILLDSQLSVNGASETVTASVRLKKTADIINFGVESVALTVKIEPIITSRLFTGIKVQVLGLSGTQNATLTEKSVKLMLTGPQNILKSIRTTDITAYVLAQELADGEYDLPVQFIIDQNEAQTLEMFSTPQSVHLKLTSK